MHIHHAMVAYLVQLVADPARVVLRQVVFEVVVQTDEHGVHRRQARLLVHARVACA